MKKGFLFVLTFLALQNSVSAAGNYKLFQTLPAEDSLKIIEKVFIHTDRDSYYPGEDIWFKAYLIDGSTKLLTSNSNNLHIELISPDLGIVESRTVQLTGGLGNGDFKLPDKIKSGTYSIRAYTNYMRNYGDDLFFYKNILVINTSDAESTLFSVSADSLASFELGFFPESGSLVDEVVSTVAFKALGRDGYGCSVKGSIFSSAGKLITGFESTHNGMGEFFLTPFPGLRYFALAKDQYGDSARFELPESLSEGVVLNISENTNDALSLRIMTNPGTLKKLINRDLFLAISYHNIPLEEYSIKIESSNNFMHLPLYQVPEGVFMVTLFDNQHVPLCERLVFKSHRQGINLNLETNKSVYMQRDSVAVRILLSDSLADANEAYLSMSATEDNISEFHLAGSSISSWFLLESDVRGLVENPSYYFDPSNHDRLKDLDLLLLTQGWRDFKWKYNKDEYLPENGFSISGRVRKKLANAPLCNSTVTIGVFSETKRSFKAVQTEQDGRFTLDNLKFTGDANLIISAATDKGDLKGMVVLDSGKFIPEPVKGKFYLTESAFHADNFPLVENQNIREDIQRFVQYAEIKKGIMRKYKLTDTIKPGEVNIIGIKSESINERSRRYLMGSPDKVIVVTPEMKLYNNTFQLLRQTMIISLVKLSSYVSHHMQHPLYLINGNRVSEAEVKALPVDAVERIDVLDDMASYSVFGYFASEPDDDRIDFKKDPKEPIKYFQLDGVISIILKDSFYKSEKPDFHSINVKYRGYDEPRVFYTPKHKPQNNSDANPDFRSTLYWEPNISVSNNKEYLVSFYNADNSSKIKIVLEGITDNGIPLTRTTEYQIK